MKLLLRSYPSLQTLKIAFDSVEYDWYLEDLPAGDILNITDVEDRWQLKKLPTGDILNSLRMVEIIVFKGLEIEIEVVRFLLENAKFLEKMNFSYPDYDQESADSQRKQSEILSTFAGIAPNVTISFSTLVYD
ncbi:hypothetical protein FRX31_025434 [Thalictrum thalictroides]|uniref:FBD domain-containing protein n=1 Tax=Thalictrum thalictroides TaxID=46969 RepID=A0A7J6VIN3_THATH|nr:hypothetical protein FRX31_025434 [Thalictrum thalictroides]